MSNDNAPAPCSQCGHAAHTKKCLQAIRVGKPGEDVFCLCEAPAPARAPAAQAAPPPVTPQELRRIEAECAECLKDREEFRDEHGDVKAIECEHCRDKMNLIAEIRRLQATGADPLAGNAAQPSADYNGEKAPTINEARVCMKCGRTESGWRYNRCPSCGELADWLAKRPAVTREQVLSAVNHALFSTKVYDGPETITDAVMKLLEGR